MVNLTENASKSWFAPAKLNLFLHVIGRRDDGLHELQTLFQLLDFGDSIRFEPTSDSVIERVGGLGLPIDDLTVRAATTLRAFGDETLGVRIHLDKRIPVGAGLGGGSSDAATTLVALNQIWALGLREEQLLEIAKDLGADVPLFVAGRSAWGEGIGERLTPAMLPSGCFCVVWPGVSVPTKAVFSDPELTRNTPPIRIPGPFSGNRRNDLEPVARKRYPAVGQCLDWLGQFGKAQMTGSGSAAFIEVENDRAGQDVINALPEDLSGWVAHGINQNPSFAEEPVGV